MTSKANHVRTESQSGKHPCSWPGCTVLVKSSMWGCQRHWYSLPAKIRQRIWDTYRPGQENDGKLSAGYLSAFRDTQVWIKEHEAKKEKWVREREARKQ
jgi:hypothetical protein